MIDNIYYYSDIYINVISNSIDLSSEMLDTPKNCIVEFDCKRSATGEEYLGNISVSKYGDVCFPWKDVPGFFKVYDKGGNFGTRACRLVSGSPEADLYKVPWCYINKFETAPCNVPDCLKGIF